jgi:hypothetical protein
MTRSNRWDACQAGIADKLPRSKGDGHQSSVSLLKPNRKAPLFLLKSQGEGHCSVVYFRCAAMLLHTLYQISFFLAPIEEGDESPRIDTESSAQTKRSSDQETEERTTPQHWRSQTASGSYRPKKKPRIIDFGPLT